MAIEKITKDTKFHAGMLICVNRSTGGIVTNPKCITKVTAAQVTVLVEGKPRNIRLSSISGYVVDSIDEGNKLSEITYQREMAAEKAASAAAAEARRSVFAEWRPRLNELLGNNNG